MDYLKQCISEDFHRNGEWSFWDDLSAYGYMSSPPMTPRGSTICVGSKPGRFIQDTHVVAAGEELQ